MTNGKAGLNYPLAIHLLPRVMTGKWHRLMRLTTAVAVNQKIVAPSFLQTASGLVACKVAVPVRVRASLLLKDLGLTGLFQLRIKFHFFHCRRFNKESAKSVELLYHRS